MKSFRHLPNDLGVENFFRLVALETTYKIKLTIFDLERLRTAKWLAMENQSSLPVI